MIVKVDKMAGDIRVALDNDRNSGTLASLGDVDTLSIDNIIRSKVTDAVEAVERACPVYKLESGRNFGDAVYWHDGDTSGRVLLPDDFMRLMVFKMSDWERPVYAALGSDDEGYNRQFSRWKGLRGTAQKPVAAIVTRPEGRALEFWSCKSQEATVERAVYAALPRIDRDGGIEVSPRCYRAAVYYAAGLTAQALGDESAKTYFEIAKTMMEE